MLIFLYYTSICTRVNTLQKAEMTKIFFLRNLFYMQKNAACVERRYEFVVDRPFDL
jgi:hypothetical protein